MNDEKIAAQAMKLGVAILETIEAHLTPLDLDMESGGKLVGVALCAVIDELDKAEATDKLRIMRGLAATMKNAGVIVGSSKEECANILAAEMESEHTEYFH